MLFQLLNYEIKNKCREITKAKYKYSKYLEELKDRVSWLDLKILNNSLVLENKLKLSQTDVVHKKKKLEHLGFFLDSTLCGQNHS